MECICIYHIVVHILYILFGMLRNLLQLGNVTTGCCEMVHPLPGCRDAAGPPDAASPMSPSRNLVTVPPFVNAKGTVKMKREDPSKTEQLVKCVSLPSLKASQMSQMSLTTSMKNRRSHDF